MNRRLAVAGLVVAIAGTAIVVVAVARKSASPTPVLTLRQGGASDHGTLGVASAGDFVFAWTADSACATLDVRVTSVQGGQEVAAVSIANGRPQTVRLPAGYLEVRTGKVVVSPGSEAQCHWTLTATPVSS